MPSQNNNAIKFLIGVAAAFIILISVRYMGPLLAPFIFDVVLAMLLYPLLTWLMSKGLSRVWAVGVLVLLVVVVFVATMSVFYYSFGKLLSNLSDYQALLQQRLEPVNKFLLSIGIDVQTLRNQGWTDPQQLLGATTDIISGLISNIVDIGVFLFVLLLLVIASPQVADRYNQNLGKHHPLVKAIADYTTNVQKVYAIQTVSNFFSAVAITIELLLFGVDYALLWGLLTFFLSYIPNIGMLLAAIPAAIIAFIQFGWATAAIIIAVGAVLNWTMDSAITPRFMGNALDVPQAAVFISLLFWAWVFGPLGVLLSLPLTLAVRALLAASRGAEPITLLLTTTNHKNTKEAYGKS